jgi:hypothetical protein
MSSIGLLLENMDPIHNLIYGMLLVVLIVYAGEVPMSIRTSLDTMGGRALGIVIMLGTLRYVGWVYALLFAIAFLLILDSASREVNEGFLTLEHKNVERPNKRWFVEKVLGERTVAIETDNVITQPVQGS